jgi:hypothetical protein
MQVGHAFLWEYSDKWLKLAQLLGQCDVFLTWARGVRSWPLRSLRRPSGAAKPAAKSRASSVTFSTPGPLAPPYSLHTVLLKVASYIDRLGPQLEQLGTG